jgi:hypothetical protein
LKFWKPKSFLKCDKLPKQCAVSEKKPEWGVPVSGEHFTCDQGIRAGDPRSRPRLKSINAEGFRLDIPTFGFRLVQKLETPGQQNLLISPASIDIALGISYRLSHLI